MAPTFAWPLLFIGLSMLYLLLSAGQGRNNAFIIGWAFGFGYFLFGLHWIGNALLIDGNPFFWAYPLAVSVLPAYLALYFGLAAKLITKLCLRHLSSWFCFGGVITVTEWLRGTLFTGFPWNLFGYTWGAPYTLSVAQGVSVFGVYGLTWATVLAATLPALLFLNRKNALRASAATAIVAALTGGLIVYGAQRLENNPTEYYKDINLRIVQPNIPQHLKWEAEHQTEIFFKHLRLSSVNYNRTADKNIVIWPETAVNPGILENPDALEYIARTLLAIPGESILMAGALQKHAAGAEEPEYYNSLVVIDEKGKKIASYDKTHLVPFGEYLPFEDIIPLEPVVGLSGLKPGPAKKTISLPEIPEFSPLVCYEVIFPGKVKASGLSESPDDEYGRPKWLLNVTNDAWYGDTAGPRQHFTISLFRAIEEGLPLVRSANTGISGVIDPLGRIVDKSEFNRDFYTDVYLPKSLKEKSYFFRYGHNITISIIAFSIFTYILILYVNRNKKIIEKLY